LQQVNNVKAVNITQLQDLSSEHMKIDLAMAHEQDIHTSLEADILEGEGWRKGRATLIFKSLLDNVIFQEARYQDVSLYIKLGILVG